MNSHNSHVTPGYYNPQVQDRTGVGDVYPDFFDPTQVPMIPGDTQVAMRREVGAPNAQHPILDHPEAPVAAPPPQQQLQMSVPISSPTQQPVYRSGGQAGSIVIPIVIELTINVRTNHV